MKAGNGNGGRLNWSEERDDREVIEADAFVLRGRQGEKRAVLGTNDEGEPFLALLDSQERPRLFVRIDAKDEPSIDLVDCEGQKRISILVAALENPGLDRADTPGLYIWDHSGVCRTILGQHPSGGSLLLLQDEEGIERISFVADEKPSVVVHDRTGKAVWKAPPAPPRKRTPKRRKRPS
jgi:hypothetical protein